MVTLKNTVQARQTTLKAVHKPLLVTLALTALLTACGLAQPSPAQVQSLVQTSVASTMQAQNEVATFVAQTVQANQPAATETQQPVATDTPTVETTETPLLTLTPVVPITPISTTASSSGGGGGYVYVPPQPWSCDPDIDKRPLDSNPPYAPGDHFEIKWTLLNNGTQNWPAGFYVSWYSVQTTIVPQPDNLPQISVQTGPIILPEVDSGQITRIPAIEGIAPNLPGHYVLTWKLYGFSHCYLYVNVNVSNNP